MKEEGSNCIIQREGIIRQLDREAVHIDVNGKSVQVPVDKVASGLVVGNVVRWSGTHWVPTK
ncbi:hypothetical protein Back11_21020 [Paenibacillus baekrokdamisoli]|uniref:Uncharacterized protein n=1 Tax=Paenibacillus baekrokdamisoli TaxID=1712516 RepID=A0A3G9IPG3_9BACL|nr:hypothetical protein [Paenibacillus baekrokdamisoli]MBB3069891.1 hypothetical protein [Paenibacillus baekrokdamisoli]BBH20757.1 hypothetical protein Back11_21020 [Paenibacillus baekrokdamisoli]